MSAADEGVEREARELLKARVLVIVERALAGTWEEVLRAEIAVHKATGPQGYLDYVGELSRAGMDLELRRLLGGSS